MNDILAKTTGETLISHTDKLIDILDYIIGKYNLQNIKNIEILKKAAKLHDIGKIESGFQKYCKDSKPKTKYTYHQHYSCAFILDYIDDINIQEIANLVLWHHGNDNNCSKLNFPEILKEVSVEDLEKMKEFSLYYGFTISPKPLEHTYDRKFSDNNNFLRTLLIFVDAAASANLSFEEIDKLIDRTPIQYSDLNQAFINDPRTQNQLDIIKDITDNNTTLIKAPAGFGKTIVGLLWFLKRNKKLLWVCPTNTITEKVYDNILSDLKLIGLNNISVELYLSGERIKATDTNLEDFSSDIVVTNIDNFIKPTIDNSFAKRSLSVYFSDIIFDELHELNKMECALLKAFNSIMDHRHNSINMTTLLLTATPTAFLFGSPSKPIISLPNINEHYKPVHNGNYEIQFISYNEYKDIIKGIENNNFVVFSNTVKDVQNTYINFDSDKMICHGKYLDEDKEIKKNLVFKNYSKNTTPKDIPLFTNQILTTACDYSVNHMFIINPTIVTFFQALGRVNRWGLFKDVSKIYIIDELDKSNISFLGLEKQMYETFIAEFKRWVLINPTTNLENLYKFYNAFVNNYQREFRDILKRNLKTSNENLEKIYPRRKKNNKKSNKKNAGSTPLRKTDAYEMYISVQLKDGKETDRVILQYALKYDGYEVFQEDTKTFNKQIKLGKEIGYYNKHQKISSSIQMKDIAYNVETPYIVFNYSYDSDIGLKENN